MIMKLFDANVIFHFSYCVLEMAAASNDTFFFEEKSDKCHNKPESLYLKCSQNE